MAMNRTDPVDLQQNLASEEGEKAKSSVKIMWDYGNGAKYRTLRALSLIRANQRSPCEIGAPANSRGKSGFSFTAKLFLGIIWPQIMD